MSSGIRHRLLWVRRRSALARGTHLESRLATAKLKSWLLRVALLTKAGEERCLARGLSLLLRLSEETTLILLTAKQAR